jgi:curved DNA-binding protein CbpA
MPPSFSSDQEKVVLKVLTHKPHQYYEILECTKTSNENEIKKSYRKLAIKLHPDKNPHPRSAEAFKVVNKAWEVLSDPSKKNIYDQTGADPDSRSAQYEHANANSPFGRSTAFQGFQGFQGGAQPFDDDIFNIFFGGGPSQTFTFGNNGFTFQSFGGPPFGGQPFMRQRRHPASARRPNANTQEEDLSVMENLKRLLPMLLLLFAVIISALFSDSNSFPDFSFTKTKSYPIKRFTPRHKIPFYVSESFDKQNSLTQKQQRNFDLKVENVYIQDTRSKCSREQLLKSEMIDDAQGWFSTDYDKLSQAQNLPMPNCEILRGFGLI